MSEKKEQVKPLAPACHGLNIEEYSDAFPVEFTTRRHRKCIKCCGCSAAILLIIVMVTLVLTFTVFRVKDPILKMNSMNIDGLDLLNSGTNSLQGINLTVEAGVSVKNPNAASFRFNNATTDVYYDGLIVGETRSPSGEARARRTVRMNVTIVIMVDQMLKVGRLESDLGAGVLPISSYTRISGKVKIMDVIKRSVVVKMNCSMSVNLRSQQIQDQNCKRRVSL